MSSNVGFPLRFLEKQNTILIKLNENKLLQVQFTTLHINFKFNNSLQQGLQQDWSFNKDI